MYAAAFAEDVVERMERAALSTAFAHAAWAATYAADDAAMFATDADKEVQKARAGVFACVFARVRVRARARPKRAVSRRDELTPIFHFWQNLVGDGAPISHVGKGDVGRSKPISHVCKVGI